MVDFKPNESDEEHYELRKEETRRGFMNKLFGSKDNLAPNIAGATIILVVILNLIVLLCDKNIFLDFAKTTFSLISLALGYLFGKN